MTGAYFPQNKNNNYNSIKDYGFNLRDPNHDYMVVDSRTVLDSTVFDYFSADPEDRTHSQRSFPLTGAADYRR